VFQSKGGREERRVVAGLHPVQHGVRRHALPAHPRPVQVCGDHQRGVQDRFRPGARQPAAAGRAATVSGARPEKTRVGRRAAAPPLPNVEFVF